MADTPPVIGITCPVCGAPDVYLNVTYDATATAYYNPETGEWNMQDVGVNITYPFTCGGLTYSCGCDATTEHVEAVPTRYSPDSAPWPDTLPVWPG